MLKQTGCAWFAPYVCGSCGEELTAVEADIHDCQVTCFEVDKLLDVLFLKNKERTVLNDMTKRADASKAAASPFDDKANCGEVGVKKLEANQQGHSAVSMRQVDASNLFDCDEAKEDLADASLQTSLGVAPRSVEAKKNEMTSRVDASKTAAYSNDNTTNCGELASSARRKEVTSEDFKNKVIGLDAAKESAMVKVLKKMEEVRYLTRSLLEELPVGYRSKVIQLCEVTDGLLTDFSLTNIALNNDDKSVGDPLPNAPNDRPPSVSSEWPSLPQSSRNTSRPEANSCIVQTVGSGRTAAPSESGDVMVEAPFQKVATRRSRRRARAQPEVLVISGSTSYADAMKGLAEVAPEVNAAGIHSIRQGAASTIRIALKPGATAAAAALKQAIAQKLPEMAVRQLGDASIVHIKDIPEGTSREEIERGVVVQLGADAEGELIRVSNVRPAYGSTLAATVRLPARFARKLAHSRRVPIGIFGVKCRVTIREEKSCCFRCWGPGHVSRLCTGEDRSHLCFRCGEAGHKALACKAPTPTCLVCNVSGHSTRASTCPRARVSHQLTNPSNGITRSAA